MKFENSVVAFMDQCGICSYSEFFGEAVGPSWNLLHYSFWAPWMFVSGWVFHSDSVLRVMDTFDDDDDDEQQQQQQQQKSTPP